MPKDSSHSAHSSLAFLNLLLGGALLRTLLIVFLDFLCLFIRNNDASQTRLISDANSNAVIAGFFHGIAVNNISKNGNSFINWRPREATVSCVWKTGAEIVSETIGRKNALIRFFQFSTDTCLCSVGFVRNANDIASLGEQPRLFTKLLDSGDIDAAAGLAFQRFLHIIPAFDAADIFLVEIFCGSHKKFRGLCIQIFPICQNDNGRVIEGFVVSLGNQP